MEKTPHGYPIIESRAFDESSRVILAKKEGDRVTPYVTWRQSLADDSCYWGHYFGSLREALGDYHRR